MPSKAKPKSESETPAGIFVSRERLSICLALGSVTDEQKDILRAGVIQKGPRDFELRDTEQIRTTLGDLGLGFTNKRGWKV